MKKHDCLIVAQLARVLELSLWEAKAMTGLEELDNGMLRSLLPGSDGGLRYPVHRVILKGRTLTMALERLNISSNLKGQPSEGHSGKIRLGFRGDKVDLTDVLRLR